MRYGREESYWGNTIDLSHPTGDNSQTEYDSSQNRHYFEILLLFIYTLVNTQLTHNMQHITKRAAFGHTHHTKESSLWLDISDIYDLLSYIVNSKY